MAGEVRIALTMLSLHAKLRPQVSHVPLNGRIPNLGKEIYSNKRLPVAIIDRHKTFVMRGIHIFTHTKKIFVCICLVSSNACGEYISMYSLGKK